MTDLTWVLSSCVLIVAVIVIRAAFGKRMRQGLRYALWGLVLLRLLVPVQLFAAPWGIAAEVPERVATQDIYVLPVERIELEDSQILSSSTEVLQSDAVQRFFAIGRNENARMEATDHHTTVQTRYAAKWSAAELLRIVWYAGIAVTAAVFLVSNLRFYIRLCRRRKPLDADCPLRVYSVENLSSSCLFGHAIYVAAETAADETRLRHVLEHELSHYRNGDHVWTLLRCAALSLHWYNPLVWWAAALSRQDSELCADALALQRLGEGERENYGATLIELSARRAKRASLLCTATTMTNGKKSLRERVAMIACRPRTTVAVVIVVALLAAAAAGCAFAGAVSAPMTEIQALDALEASLEWGDDAQGVRYVSFTLPKQYERAEHWTLHISGRAVYDDGMSMSQHFFENEKWKAGGRYTIEINHLTELVLQATLAGQDGKAYERMISLLPDAPAERYASADAYLDAVRARITSATYYAADGSGEKTAAVLDTRVAFLDKDGELAGLSPDGTLELYNYLIETKLDVPLRDVAFVGGMYAAEGGWCDLEGQGGHTLILLRHADGSVLPLTDRPNNDDRGGLYYYEENAAELLYDFYVKETGLDLPLYTTQLGALNAPAHRRDGDGWYLYVPIQGWYRSDDGSTARWFSSYGTGSTLIVRESSREEMQAERQTLAPGEAERFVEASDGSVYLVWTQYDPMLALHSDNTGLEPGILAQMAQSFTVNKRTHAPEGGDPTAELNAFLQTLYDTQPDVMLTLFDGGAKGRYPGKGTSNASYVCNVLSHASYTRANSDIPPTGGNCVRLEALGCTMDVFGNGVYFRGANGAVHGFCASGSYDHIESALRLWYDEAELRGLGGGYDQQDAIVIPDRGQGYLAAAQEHCDRLYDVQTHVTPGSTFCYTYVKCTVEAAEDETKHFRENGRISENTWAIGMTEWFVPENEQAMGYGMAGNTLSYDEYVRDYNGAYDPSIPEGAYICWRVGYVTKDADGYHTELVGTGW